MTTLAQRWRDGAEYRRGPDSRIRPAEFGVDVLPDDRRPKAFVQRHHYAGTYPSAQVRVGLWRKVGVQPAALVGLAVFSVGVKADLGMPRWTGYPASEGTELGRFVLLPEVAYNGETWFLRRAFDCLRREKPAMRAVLSYADPIERFDQTGRLVKPGHYGTIYQASNALFAGRAAPRGLLVLPDGRVLQGYAFNKVRRRARGWQGCLNQIAKAAAALGLEEWGREESEDAWQARVKAAIPVLRHPGNLAYVFGLDTEAWKRIRTLHGGGRPYPKAYLAS